MTQAFQPRDPVFDAIVGSFFLLDERGWTASADLLSLWRNQSGVAGLDVSQPVVADQPATNLVTIGGWPAPRFDGVGDFERGTALLSSYANLDQHHAFVVFKATAYTAGLGVGNRPSLFCFPTNNYLGLEVYQFGVGDFRADAYVAGVVQTVEVLGLAVGVDSLLEWSRANGVQALRLAGNASVGGACPANIVLLPGSFLRVASALGFPATQFFAGSVGCLLICKEAQSATTSDLLRAYFAKKYGVSV